MADIKIAEYYQKIIENDPLLPQIGEPLATKVLRIQEEHELFAKNAGRERCSCIICNCMNISFEKRSA